MKNPSVQPQGWDQEHYRWKVWEASLYQHKEEIDIVKVIQSGNQGPRMAVTTSK